LAGPVVAAAVILLPGLSSPLLTDSKKLTPRNREIAFDLIAEKAVAVGIGVVENEEIDRINILEATKKAMRQAVSNLNRPLDHLLVDGIHTISYPVRQWAVKGGEMQSHSIAAASIVAKVTRDRMMEHYHHLYPRYNFRKNKGYGTAEHLEALRKYGMCPLHRRTFRGVCT
jgi:ribonuclease HII